MRVVIGCRALCVLLVLAFTPTGRASPQIRLAVIDFQPSGAVGEYETLGAGLQSMLTTDLSAVTTITVVERAQLAALQRELKLSRSALADPKTALRIGKMAGASHLLAGSFTLVGSKMRLDARVIDVATAKVHFAAKIEGDKDAFFELEKSLAAQVIESVGVHPSAKERGVLGRVHTTDLPAFQKFSQGLVLFDEQHYDRALEALKDAAKRDEEFKLARSTLQQYERVAEELRAKAQLLDAQSAAQGALARKEELSAAQAVQQRLLAIADRSSAPQRERAAALYLLASMSDVTDDHFANERMRELFITRYMLEFSPLFPKFAITPVEPFGERFSEPEVPADASLVPSAVAAAAAAITFQPPETSAEHIEERRKESVSSNFQSEFDELVDLLPLDIKGRANALQRLYDLGAKFVPGTWQAKALAKIALRRRQSLELKESTRLLREAAISSSNSYDVRDFAREVETNARIARAFERVGTNKCLRERLIGQVVRGDVGDLEGSLDIKGDPCASRDLMFERLMSKGEPLQVGETRAWLLSRELPSVVWSGPRSDGYHTNELRYVSSADPSATDAPRGAWSIVMFEGIPRALAEVRFNLSYDQTEDVSKATSFERYSGPELRGELPNVTVIFGARNVLATGRDRKPIPMRASGVTIGAGRVMLADVETALTSNQARAETLRLTTKKSTAIELPRKGSIAVKVVREQNRLAVEVAGQQVEFDSGPAAHGFIGIVFEGRGFVRVLQPKISGAK